MKTAMRTTFVNADTYAGIPIRLIRWTEPPPMDTGSPIPAVRELGTGLFLAYVCHNPDFPGWNSTASPEHHGFDTFTAILHFADVSEHYLGPPNDEALHLHPLYTCGLRF